ncbi:hypothetical protein COJ18_27605 [Bacillus cereus]|uniref:hypothetical protein n=1 Tax=Bacillus cereus TaxID=1396 RepID=UPI000BF30655|nr:hypothetical protein [Bacillus cereus]PFK30588.1 hypothetical protein COJ18_27605 [Bacillus cereus]PFR14218.1 hypothetical protein COK23_28475 [Bacillus cereus]
MSLVQFNIETEPYNSRSNQIALKLVINNNSEEKINLISLTPNVPMGVEIEERRESFQESTKEKIMDLCSQLTQILNYHIFIKYEDVKKEIIAANKELMDEVLSSPKQAMNVYLTLMKPSMISQERKRIHSRLDAARFKIQNLEDAKWAYDKWFSNLDNDSIEKNMYEGKLEQLKNLEGKMNENESNTLAVIEPKSSYTRSYVIKFKRRLFSQKIFNITIDGLYTEDNLSGQYRGTVSEPVTISPQSFALTFLAVFASILGSILKYNLENTQNYYFSEYTDGLFRHLITGNGISSAIVAMIFFNIYEHINFGDFSKSINKSPNWQVALLIGILSGLMADKIVKALNIFIGI